MPRAVKVIAAALHVKKPFLSIPLFPLVAWGYHGGDD
jgi:hypothetical protein